MTKTLNKVSVVGAVLAFALSMIPLAASAATNITFLNFPGTGPNATIQAGDTVDTKVTFDLTSNSELESMSLQIVDNNGNDIGMPETCFDVSDRVVSGTFTRVGSFDTTGGTEGTFGVRVRGYGVTGPGTDNNCGGTVNDNQYFSNRLTLTEDQNNGGNANNTGAGQNNSGSVSGSTAGSSQAQMTALIALLTKLVAGGTVGSGTTTTASAACTAYAQANGGTQMGVYNDANVRLQGFLLSQGASIPALKAGASFGFYGPQTQAAVAWFNSTNHCN